MRAVGMAVSLSKGMSEWLFQSSKVGRSSLKYGL